MYYKKKYWLDRGLVDHTEHKYKDVCLEELERFSKFINSEEHYYDNVGLYYLPSVIVSLLLLTNYTPLNYTWLIDCFIHFYNVAPSSYFVNSTCHRYSNGNFNVEEFSFAFQRLYALKLTKNPMPILEFMG